MRVSQETINLSLFIESRGALRRELQRCLRTGRAMHYQVASGPVRSGPWWSAAAAMWCCFRCPTGSPPSGCARS
jgi:hypothetical protein